MKTLVVGVGNRLLRDEGVGCHVADALRGRAPLEAEAIDWGTCPDPPPSLAGADAVLVVDACKAGGRPGDAYRFTLDDLACDRQAVSFHDVSFVDSLPLLSALYGIRHVVLIGIECAELGWGLELSAELEARLPQLVELVAAELHNTEAEAEECHAYTTAETAQ
jgi:hydrogenase maturation protease